MARSPRLLALLVVPLLAFGASACGVSGGETSAEPEATTTAPAPEGAPDEEATTTAPDEEEPADEPSSSVPDDAVDALAEIYTGMGFSEEEASCLAGALADDTTIDTSDPTALMDVINECDIPLSRLSEIFGGMSGDSPDDLARNSLAAGFEAAGLSEEDAACVADGFVDEFGSDTTAASDPEAMTGLLEACGVDPSSLGG